MKRSPLFVICLVGLVDLSSFGLIIPLLPTYAYRFGVSATVLGAMLGSYSLSQFVFAPLLGRWSDRIGRRPVLLISVAGSVLSHALLGVADLAHSIPLLFVARVLDGITGANIATAQAYVADVTSGADRARGMGLFGAMIGLGFVVGPALGGTLLAIGTRVSGEWGTSWPAFGAAAVSVVALVLVWKTLPEPQARVRAAVRPGSRFIVGALPGLIRNRRVGELLGLFSVLTFAFVFLEATFVYICQQRFGISERNVMFVFVYYGLVMVVVRGGMVGRLAKRFGEPTLIAVGPFITAVGFLLISGSHYCPEVWVLLIACLPIAVGTSITEPSLHALLSRQSDASVQGLTFGAANSLASLARGVVPLIAGAFYDRSVSMPYVIAGVTYLLAGIVAVVISERQRQALSVPAAQIGRSPRPASAEDGPQADQ